MIPTYGCDRLRRQGVDGREHPRHCHRSRSRQARQGLGGSDGAWAGAGRGPRLVVSHNRGMAEPECHKVEWTRLEIGGRSWRVKLEYG